MIRRFIRKQAEWRRAARSRRDFARQLNGTHPVISGEFHNRSIGFWAHVIFAMQLASLAENAGKRAHIRFTSENYLDRARGDEWFGNYFEHVGLPAEPPGPVRFHSHDIVPDFPATPQLAQSHELFSRNFRVLPVHMDAVEAAVEQLGVSETTLGVHYRGTDKAAEAELLSHDRVIDAVAEMVDASGYQRIFVASDDARFCDVIARKIRTIPVVQIDDSCRSMDGRPIHLGGGGEQGYALGRDALLNCLLLSRCGALVRTASNLSAWSSIFRPDLPVTLLSLPRADMRWYPETIVAPVARKILAAADADGPRGQHDLGGDNPRRAR